MNDAFTNEVLKNWLQDESKQKYVADSKATQAILQRMGIELRGVTFDLLLASYIANPAISSDDVQALAKEFGYLEVQSNEAIYGKGAKWTRPEESVLADHVARKALAVWHLQPVLEEKLKANEQFELYKNGVGKDFRFNHKKRPDGGAWTAFGFMYPMGYSSPASDEVGKYSICGRLTAAGAHVDICGLQLRCALADRTSALILLADQRRACRQIDQHLRTGKSCQRTGGNGGGKRKR